jgi:peptide/nickel transport system substrate-binding protein
LRNRSSRLSVLVVILVAACQGAVTPSPPIASAPSSGNPSPGASGAIRPSLAPETLDLFGTAYAPAAGRDGGTIVIGDWHEANQFHPYFVAEETDARVASAAWATLVVMTADQKLEPDLAAAIPTLANGGVRMPGDGGDAMTVTWQLRDGLKWSDGEPLTCDDMKYAWEWVTDSANVGVSTAGFEDIKDFECSSATDMVWHFDRPYADYLTLMIAPLPRHYLASIPITDQTAGVGFRPGEIPKLPVSGAFSFESAIPGGEIRMVRNPEYTSWSTGTPAHLDRLIWRWFTSPETLIAGYKNGEVSVATSLRDVDRSKVASPAAQVSSIASRTYELLRPNWSTAACSASAAVVDRGAGCPMSDPALRRAVALAIDRDELNTKLFGGNVVVVDGNVSPGSWFFAAQPAVAFDPAEARAVLAAAGWRVGPGGIRVRDGLTARIELCAEKDTTREALLAIIAGRLRDVGIEAVPNAVATDDMHADLDTPGAAPPCALARGNYDIAAVDASIPLDPLDYFFRYHSSQVSPNGANEGAVSDPLIDTALRAIQTTPDFAMIQDAMAEFQRVYVEKTVEIPLYDRTLVELHSPKLGNFAPSSLPGGSTWNVVDWFVKA